LKGDSLQVPAIEIRTVMQHTARRQWWLWSTAMLVVILLVVGIESFSFPGLLSQQTDSEFYRLNLSAAVRGLIGLVLLFGVYVVYQQLQIRRIDLEVFDALGKIQDRAENVYKSAGRDNLTHLYNRKFGEERLVEEMSRSRRLTRPLIVLRVNLDGLNELNDQLGPESVECAIRLFADHLQHELRDFDVPIRLDRAQFLVVLPECRGGEAEIIVNRLNRMVLKFGDRHLAIIAGWAEYVDGEQCQALVMRAEGSLYNNKRSEEGATRPVKVSISFGSDKIPSARLAKLPAREREVLVLLAQGKSNKEVANALNLSTRTVETYRKNIMSRLDVHSATELVLFAISEKLIDVG
jgi:diguanylate cyclase (GGDEF)-like protein